MKLFDTFSALRTSVMSILERPQHHEWTVQGFGFIRTYLDDAKRYRLNVWHPDLKRSNVSTIHDHPWHLSSIVLNGVLTNVRYYEHPCGTPFQYHNIKTGEDGGPVGETTIASLLRRKDEEYTPGMAYYQDANEIHETFYSPGCVTLNDRTKLTVEEKQIARVFWPMNTIWVDAKPIPARMDEVYDYCVIALEQMKCA